MAWYTKFSCRVLFLGGIIGLVSPFQVSAASLTFNNVYASDHPLSEHVFRPWAESLRKATGGRMIVTVVDSGVLGRLEDTFDNLEAGRADIAIVCPSNHPGTMPLSMVFDLPFVASSTSRHSSLVLWDTVMANPSLLRELEGYTLLWAYMNPPYQLHSRDEPITGFTDLRMQPIGAGNRSALRALRLLGASARHVSMVDTADALRGGEITGAILPYAPLRSQGIADHLRAHTEINLMSISFFVIMPTARWEMLTPDEKAALRDMSGRKMAEKTGEVFDRFTQEDIAWMRQRGDHFHSLPFETVPRLQQMVLPLHEAWVDRAGFDGARELLQSVISAMHP